MPLSSLAGWDIPGLESVEVVDGTSGPGYFIGELPALTPVGAPVVATVAGIDLGGGRMVLVIDLPPFSVGDYLPQLDGSALDDIRLDSARLVLAPPEATPGTVISPPQEVSGVIADDFVLPDGERLDAVALLTGELGSWLGGLGTPAADLPVSGTLPMALFTAEPGVDVIPAVDLTLTVPDASLGAVNLPLPGASLSALALRVVGSSSGLAFELAGSLDVGSLNLEVTGGPPSAGEDARLAVSGSLTLADLAGVAVPALDAVDLQSVTLSGETVSAGLQLGDVQLQVLAFPASGGSGDGRALSLTAPSLTIADLVPAAAETPLADLRFEAPTFLYSETDRDRTPLPPELAARLGTSALDLDAGLSLSAAASLTGETGSLLTALGVPVAGLPLAAGLDPTFLSAPASLPDLRIVLDLGTATVDGATFGDVHLTLASVTGVVSAEVTTDLTLSLAGRTVSLPQVSVLRDSDGTTRLSGPFPVAVLGDLLPLPGVTPLSATLTLELSDAGTAVGVTGSVNVGGKVLGVDLQTDGGAGSVSLGLSGSITLGELSGLSVPGLSDLAISDVSVSTSPTSSHTAGGIAFGGVATTVVLFRDSGQPAMNLALLADALTLGNLIPPAQGTPLDALAFAAPAIFVTPAANGEQSVAEPAPVAQHRGSSGGGSLSLSPGIHIESTAGLAPGPVADLLASVGVPTTDLPLAGIMAPDAFAPGAIQPPDFDLIIPLPDLSLPIPSSLLQVGDARLRLRVQDGDPSIGIETTTDLDLAGKSFHFVTAITRGREAGVDFTDIRGTSPSTWHAPFGVAWLELEDLSLAARFGGGTSLAVGATTDVGSIHNLDVEIAIAFDGGGFDSASLSLTGADIPLSEIPAIGDLPGLDQVKLRDVVVSNTALAGMARLGSGPWLDAVLFQSQKPTRGWNLALLYQDVSLPGLIPVLPQSDPVLSMVQLETAALVISQKGIEDEVGELPGPAQERMLTLYGASDRSLRLPNGVAMVAGFDPTVDPALVGLLDAAGVGSQKLVLSGAIGGLFGGTPSLDIAASLPSAKVPDALSSMFLLKEVQSAFFVRLQTLGPSVGVGLTATSDMIVGLEPDFTPHKIETDAIIEFQLNATGGVTVAAYGETKEAWEKAFEIPGLTLDPGCLLGISVSASSEILMDVTAQTQIGDREVDLTGQAGLLGGYPAKAALIGQVSEMGMDDVLALNAAIVSAGGGTPPRTDFPTARLTDTGIGFASPLALVRLNEVELLGPGAYIEGDLWLIQDDQPLGRFKGIFDLLGLSATGDIRDFDLGAFAMRGNLLDVYARVDPFNPPHFRVRGNAMVGTVESTIEMEASTTGFAFYTAQDVAEAEFSYDFGAYFNGPTTLTPEELVRVDLGLDCGLELGAIEDFLEGPGAEAVGTALGGASDALAQAQAGLAAATAEVQRLDAEIDAARAQVEAERGTIEEQIEAAQRAVTAARTEVDRLEDLIDDYKSKLQTCNQKKKVCLLRDPFSGKCLTYAWVADLTARAQCAATNARYTALIVSTTAELQVARAGLTAANTSLAILLEGSQQLPIDLDPRVAALILQREAALLSLQVAQATVAGLQEATAAAQSGLALFQQGAGAIELVSGRLHGSVNELVRNQPVVLDLVYRVNGQPSLLRLPFNPVDPIYTFDHMQLLALQIVYAAALADPGAPQSYKDFTYRAYLDKKALVDAELAIVAEQNAVPVLEGDDELLANQGPEVTPPPDVQVEAGGPRTVVNIGVATATDLLDGDVPVESDAPADYPVGLTVVTWTAQDAAGNPGTATQRVVVVDTTPPALTVPGDVAGVEAVAALTPLPPGSATASDVVDGDVAVVRHGPQNYPIGLTQVLWRAIDAAGNVAEAVQTVEIVDTTPPAVTAPPALVGVEATALLTAIDPGAATAVDLVDGPVVAFSDAPSAFQVGTTTVTWSAKDAAGNTNSATQSVEVVDTTPPSLTPPGDLVVEATGPQTAVDPGEAAAADAVGVVSLAHDLIAPLPLGEATVTWTARDAAGNVTTATQRVGVVDTTPPDLTVPADVVAWEATAPLSSVDLGVAAAVDLVDGEVEAHSDAPAAFPVGVTEVTWTARDARGNESTAVQRVEVVDTTPPAVTPPVDIAAFEATAPGSPVPFGAATATDAVGVTAITDDAPEAFPVGITVVTWKAHDAAGNVGVATQRVEVVDTTPPVVTPPENMVVEATGPQTPIDPGTAGAVDAVGVVAIVSDAPAEFPLGETVVTWKAHDAAGNAGTATQVVKVVDTTPPAVMAPPAVVGFEATGPLTAVDIGAAVAVDLVDGPVAVSSDAPGHYPVGTTTITWSATDAAGNTGTATQAVQVVDTTPPTLAFFLDTYELWPVSHKLVSVSGPVTATDLVDAAPAVEVSITSNQLIDGPGDGHTETDWEVVTGQAGAIEGLALRAERSGKGKEPRIYTVTVTATDRYANAATVTGEVIVPHSKGAAKRLATGLELVVDYALYANAPNPFNPSTTVRFDVPEVAPVEVRVFNMLGQPVRLLLSEEMAPGSYQITWDGRDDEGRPAATAVYLLWFRGGTVTQARRMTLLR